MNIKLKIICDFKLSEFCKIEYNIDKYKININKLNNNGKYRCKYCAIFQTHYGNKSHLYKNFNIKHDYFSIIDSEIKAYLLGVIAGDGHVGRKHIEIVANNKDIETLLLFTKFICQDNKIVQSKGSNCSRLNIPSRQIVKDVCLHLKINYGKKSDKISLPNLSDELLIHFIRGLMDTDGCIDNPFTSKHSPRCFYSSTSNLILNQVKSFFDAKGYRSYINGIKLTFVAKGAVSFLNDIYNNSTYSLSRKKAFYDIWKTWIPYQGTIINPSKRKIKSILKEIKK